MAGRGTAFHLAAALRLEGREHLALVGAGGKTRTLFTLARQLAPALAATTTHLARGEERAAQAHRVWPRDISPSQARAALDAWSRKGVLLVTGPAEGGRWSATPALATLQAWAREHHIPVLIEADGAARHDLKAPAPHEPAWPPQVDGILVLAHAAAIDRPLAQARVHRPERFAALAQIAPHDRLSVEAVARVLRHPQGPLRERPAGTWAQAVVRAEEPLVQARAGRLARALVRPPTPYASALVVYTTASGQVRPLAVAAPRAGVVLAAGGARRFGGHAKVLLRWQGEPLVRHSVRAALEADLWPVVVVVGAHAEAVAAAVNDLPVTVLPNPDWATGLASSIRRAVAWARSQHPVPAALVFFPADHPYIPASLPRALVAAHATTLAPIIAPLVQGARRGQPVLFDQRTYADLAALTGDVGGRALLRRYPLHSIPWHDATILMDVDTPDDWARWQGAMP